MKRGIIICQKRSFGHGPTIHSHVGGLPHQPSSGHLTIKDKMMKDHYRFKGKDKIYRPLIITGPPCSGKVSKLLKLNFNF